MKWLDFVQSLLAFVGAVLMSLDFIVGERRLEQTEQAVRNWLSERRSLTNPLLLLSAGFRALVTKRRWQLFYLAYMSITCVAMVIDHFASIGYLKRFGDQITGWFGESLFFMIALLLTIEVAIPLIMFFTVVCIICLAVVFFRFASAIITNTLLLFRRLNARGHVIGGIGLILFLLASFLQLFTKATDAFRGTDDASQNQSPHNKSLDADVARHCALRAWSPAVTVSGCSKSSTVGLPRGST